MLVTTKSPRTSGNHSIDVGWMSRSFTFILRKQVKETCRNKHGSNMSGFELVKQNQFAKISERSEEKDPPQAKKFLDLQIIL